MTRFAFILVALAACTDTKGLGFEGPQSLAITLKSPADPGSPDVRLPDTARAVVVDIEARDEFGELDPTFSTDLQVYAQFLGTLSPSFGAQPLTTLHIEGGRLADASITLPRVFGPTVVWIDDGFGVGSDYVHGKVTGTTPELWFRDPFISDLQTPVDETRLDALTSSPLQDKQIAVGGVAGSESAKGASRYGARGRLVVNSVFAQGYTVSDVQCADDNGTPPCTSGDYDHAMVFTFSAPRASCSGPGADFSCSLEVGSVISGFTGGQSEFLGLTEIGFPQTFAPVDDQGQKIVNPALLPEPAVFVPDWFKPLTDPNGRINFERNEAAPIRVDNAVVCDLDDDFAEFKQWKLDPAGVGGDCSRNDDVIAVVTTGITGIDPAALVGKTIPTMVGVLRPLNFDNGGNIWLIFPRSVEDCPACMQ